MVSGIKNFFLTFLLAAVIFGLCAAAVLGIVINNINGVIADGNTPAGSSAIDTSGPEDPRTEQNTFTILVIGSDFREGVYADYDPAQLKSLFGIESKVYSEPTPPSDVGTPSYQAAAGLISDKSREKNTVTVTEDGSLAIPGGFYSVDTRSVEANIAVFLVFRFDTNTLETIPVSTDAEIDVKGKKVPVSEFLGRYGIESFCSAVASVYTRTPDRYLFVAAKDFPAFMNLFGTVEFRIPTDMRCTDYWRDLHVNLKAGQQTLDGNTALELLMFEKYDSPTYNRKSMTADFIRQFLATVLSQDAASRVPDQFRQAEKYIQTNLTDAELRENLSRFAACVRTAN